MPLTIQNFQSVAQSGANRVILDTSSQGLTTPGAKVNSAAQKVQNQAVHHAFTQALRDQFGGTITIAVTHNLRTDKPLSAKIIRNTLNAAAANAQKMQQRNISSAMAQIGPRIAQNPALPPFNARDVNRMIAVVVQEQGHLCSQGMLAGQAMQNLLDTVMERLSGPAVQAGRPHGLELLRNPQFSNIGMVNVEDRVKNGTIQPGDQVGPYEFVQLKQKGVEPGFEATLAWQPDDNVNMGNPTHEFHGIAEQCMDSLLGLTGQPGHPFAATAQVKMDKATQNLQKAIYALENAGVHNRAALPEALQKHELAVEAYHHAENNLRQTIAAEIPVTQAMTQVALAHIAANAPDLLAAAQDDLGATLRTHPDLAAEVKTAIRNDAGCAAHLQASVKTSAAHFTTIHYIKMDYTESDKTISHKLRIPTRTAKGTMHREFTAHSRKDANLGALRETLATDLMRSMGIVTQEARLIRGIYADGKMKLMLEAAHMSGVDINTGQQASFRDFSGSIVDGTLVAPDGKSDHSMPELGRNKILMLMLADRDAIGSRGDNKGRMGGTFAAIDPGHSLKELMSFQNVNSDFSFEQPSRSWMKFKNFTIFDDCTYQEKMQGVKQMLDMRAQGTDMAVFDGYANWLDTERETINTQQELAPGAKKDALEELDNLQSNLESMRTAFTERRDYILDEVFGERAAFINDQPFILEQLSNLEKLSSPTSTHSKNGEVELEHLRVTDRQEWHISRAPDGGYTFTTKGDTNMLNKLTDFFQPALIPSRHDGTISLTVPQGQVQNFCNTLTEDAVKLQKQG